MAPPYGQLITTFACLLLKSVCLCAVVDLEIVFFDINGLVDKIPLEKDTPVLPTVNFRNSGPDPVTEPEGDELNFAMNVYFSDSGDPDSATYWENMGPSTLSEYMVELFKSASTVGYTIGGTNYDEVINIPSEDCEFVKYLCLEIIFANMTRYTDPHPANNIQCAQFGPRSEGKIGEIECYIDIQATHGQVTNPTSLSHMPGVISTFTVEMQIRNNGQHSVNIPPSGQHNFAPKIYLTDGATLESSAFNILQDGNDVTFDHTMQPGETLTFPSFQATVTVPLNSELCERVTHLCIEITLDRAELEEQNYGDEDVCLELKSVAAGGGGIKLGCPTPGADVAMQSFEVRDASSVSYDIGMPTTITVDTNIVNLGSQSILASATDNNFRFELFITDSMSGLVMSTSTLDVAVDDSSATNLRSELIYGFPVNISSLVATVTLPPSTSLCRSFNSMCLNAILQNHTSNVYVDVNLNNNYICLPFNTSETGFKICPELDIDLQLSNLVVSPLTGNSFPIDVRTQATISVQATNHGPGSIPEVTGSNTNFRIVAYLTDDGDLDDANFTLPLTGISLPDDQSQQGLAAGLTIPFSVPLVGITIPREYCDIITNLCIRIELDGSSLYTDTTPELADACADIRHYIDCFIDLAAIQLTVVTPPPVTYDPGYRDDIVSRLTVMNHGGITIGAADDYNFKPRVFLTNSGVFTSASFQVPLEGVFSTFSQEIVSKSPVTLPDLPISIIIPTNRDKCEQISHLCLLMVHNIANYNDTDSNNDHVCIEFGDAGDGKAGVFSCNVSVDLEAAARKFSPVEVYTFDEPTSVDVKISVTNIDSGNIAKANGSNVNYDVNAYLTDSANFEDATVRIPQPDVVIPLDQLQEELKSGDELTLSFTSDIIVPYVNCSLLSHICFTVTLHRADDRVYQDVNNNNDDVCIEFGPKDDGKAGEILCYVDLAALSLAVLDPQPLTHEPGRTIDVSVRLTVTNFGGLDVSTAPSWTHNFGTAVYLTDSDNLYTSTNITQPPVDKLFLHEVGSHFRVSLPVFSIKVNIPTNIDCEYIRYVCILLLHNEERYVDVDRSNDYVCIQFGPVDRGMAGEVRGCDDVTDYPRTTAHPRSTTVTTRRLITTTQTHAPTTTKNQSRNDLNAGDGLGKIRTEGLALHYVMIIVSLVFITVVVVAVIIIKFRKGLRGVR